MSLNGGQAITGTVVFAATTPDKALERPATVIMTYFLLFEYSRINMGQLIFDNFTNLAINFQFLISKILKFLGIWLELSEIFVNIIL